ncbi:MAG TPA: reverse transcriptase family protein [Flavobacteriales bacterium]|nr:reverse transcriptase family protein [Flavobacteriales bacterium]
MIHSKRHLLFVTGLDKEGLGALLEYVDQSYTPYTKKKVRSDGSVKERRIEPSVGLLKKVQKRLNRYIQANCPFPEYVMGGLKGKDSILNAKFHQGNKYFFTTDLKNCFPSMDRYMVNRALSRAGVRGPVARLVTSLVTYQGHLPQGAPTSSIISSLVFVTHVGRKIERLIAGKAIRFTLYVDDLTFSAEQDFRNLCEPILDTLRSAGLKISHDKTHYGSKAEITGIRTTSSGIRPKNEHFDKLANAEGSKKVGLQYYIGQVKKVAKTPRRKHLAKKQLS